MKLHHFSQKDTRWKDEKLGLSTTIGSHGCLCTCLSMALQNYAIDLTPLELVRRLKSEGGIAVTGDLLWKHLEKILPGQAYFIRRQDTTLHAASTRLGKCTPEEALRRINVSLSLGLPVPVLVAYRSKTPNHWVLLTQGLEGGGMFCYDPLLLDGPVLFQSRYGSPEASIYGYALVGGTPVEFPEQAGADTIKLGAVLGKVLSASRDINRELNLKEAVELILG